MNLSLSFKLTFILLTGFTFSVFEIFESLGPSKRIIAKILLIISDRNSDSFDCGGYDRRLSYKTSILSTVNT